MGLVEDLNKPAGGGCQYSMALAQLTTAEAEAVEFAVAGSEWGPTALSDILAENKVVVSHQSISRHRKGACSSCLS